MTPNTKEPGDSDEASRSGASEFRLLFELAPISIAVSCAGRHVRCNKAFEDLFGWTEKEIIGRSILEVIAPSSQDKVREALAKHANGDNGPLRYELVGQRKDGTEFPFDLIASTYQDGGTVFSIANHIDLTERKRADERIRSSESKYRALVETTDTGYLILDHEGKVIDANQEYVRMSGHSRLEEILGRTVIEWTSDKARKRNADAVAQCMKDGFIRNFTVDYVDKNGRMTPIEINATVQKDGGAVQIISLCRDVSERRRVEKKILEAEGRFGLLIKSLPVPVFLKNRDGQYAECNDAFSRYLGLPREKIIHSTAFDIAPREMAEVYQKADEQLYRQGIDQTYEARVKYADGTTHDVMFFKSICRNEDEEPTGFVGCMFDITDRKRAEEHVSSLSQRLQLATKSVKIGVWDWDVKNNIMVWDDRMLELYGLTKENFPGGVEAWQNGLHPADRARTIEECQAALRGEKIWDTTFRVLHPNGTVKHLKADGIVLRNGEGVPLRMLGVNSDITEQVNVQAQLLQTSKLASIGTLAAGVAHEINNPLTVIKGSIGLLKGKMNQTTEDAAALSLLEKQNREVERIVNIVNGLRTFARADTDTVENVDIHKVITDTLNLCESIFKKSGLEIQTDFRCSNPIVAANIGKLQQVVMNLLTNAKDATESVVGGGLIKIETSDDGEIAVVRVSDNGTGIKTSDLPHIFDPFFTTKDPGKGTGLGLSISNSIVAGFGGTLSVESDVGLGTIFEMKLPATRGAATIEKTKTPGAEMKLSGSALIVDDEPEILEMLKIFLRDMGLQVTAADNGQDALEMLKQKQFDYVVTDIKMPGMSGDKVLVEARKIPHLENTFFIVITGGIVTDYTKEQRDVIRELAHGYLRKPFDKDELCKSLEVLNKNKTKGGILSELSEFS